MTTATAPATAPATLNATEKQLAFIARLLEEGRSATIFFDGTKAGASRYIEALLASPRRATPAPAAQVATPATPAVARPTSVGMYRQGEDIYRVKESETGNLYAMKLTAISGQRLRDSDEAVVRWTFVYERGAIHQLTAADKLTLEEAKQWGIRTGTCCVCARLLTDAKSVLAGIGPVCARNV